MDLNDVLGDEPIQETVPETTEPVAEALPEPVAEGPIEASAPAEVNAQEEPVAEQPATVNPFQGFVPIATMMAEKRKAQAAEQRLAEYEAYFQALEAEQGGYEQPIQPQQAQSIDRAFQAHLQANLVYSIHRFGEAAVESARAYSYTLAEQNPELFESIRESDDPFGNLIQYQQQQEMLANPAAFIQRHAAQYGFIPAPGGSVPSQQMPAAQQAPQAPTSIRSTSSLASGGKAAAPANAPVSMLDDILR